jgi:hypothetical protein
MTNNFRIDSVGLPPLLVYNQLCKQHEDKAQRIATLEAALREIVDDIEKCPEISANGSVLRIAKKALGDCIPNTTVK